MNEPEDKVPSREILKALVAVIRSELDLAADQVTIYNQRWVIPPDDRLYVSIKISGSKPYAVNRRYANRFVVKTATEVDSVLDEQQSINSQDVLTINVYSHGETPTRPSQARLRRNEVILALNSTLAEQAMETGSFSIGRVPVSYVDVSEGEGTDMLSRYAITFNLLYAQGRSKPVDYFDQFQKPALVLQP